MYVLIFTKKNHQKDISETNEIGYLQGLAWKCRGKDRGCDTSLGMSFCVVPTFGIMYCFNKNWENKNLFFF